MTWNQLLFSTGPLASTVYTALFQLSVQSLGLVTSYSIKEKEQSETNTLIKTNKEIKKYHAKNTLLF